VRVRGKAEQENQSGKDGQGDPRTNFGQALPPNHAANAGVDAPGEEGQKDEQRDGRGARGIHADGRVDA
jgi:hypothetical protein